MVPFDDKIWHNFTSILVAPDLGIHPVAEPSSIRFVLQRQPSLYEQIQNSFVCMTKVILVPPKMDCFENFNFRQAMSQKRLKLKIVFVDTPASILLTDLSHYPSCFASIPSVSQQIVDASGADLVLFGCHWHIIWQTIPWVSVRATVKNFLLTKQFDALKTSPVTAEHAEDAYCWRNWLVTFWS